MFVRDKIKKYLDNKTIVLNSSCGYGNFFNIDIDVQKIGNDIDNKACNTAKNNFQCIDILEVLNLITTNKKGK